MSVFKWGCLKKTSPPNLDDPETVKMHRQLLQTKPILKDIYTGFYRDLMNRLPDQGAGQRVIELGSGGSFLRDLYPHVVTSDLPGISGVDQNFNALQMPFENSSLDALCLTNVLHHLPDAKRFFQESTRCLKPGGRLLMLEPANTIWGAFVYRYFHHEPFDPKSGWEIKGEGRMTGSNQALPWIIFFRDRQVFESVFPLLEIREIIFHTPFRYLLSGGFSHPQRSPLWADRAMRGFEKMISPLNRWLGLFMTIEVQKGR